MNRLQSELRRLYFPLVTPSVETGSPAPALTDATGKVRALVMTLTRPASWSLLAKVWHGVQADLGLPAPAIAVSGDDALQLWFSLEEVIEVPRAESFLTGLRIRFMPEVASDRVGLMPGTAPLVPALQAQTGNWSAFVAPDLAPVFEDTPWLDLPPNEEGQAALLCSLKSIQRGAFEAALLRLEPRTDRSDSTAPRAPHNASETTAPPPAMAASDDEPRRFLTSVMNDETVAMALRIEAAKALLQRPS